MATKKGADAGNSKKTATPASFKPGQSGNPNGRPKRTPEELDLIAACKAKTPQALNTMLEIMEHGENERNRLAAAQAIIERGHGKAVQPTLNTPADDATRELMQQIFANPNNRLKVK